MKFSFAGFEWSAAKLQKIFGNSVFAVMCLYVPAIERRWQQQCVLPKWRDIDELVFEWNLSLDGSGRSSSSRGMPQRDVNIDGHGKD
jgi:hypothetical protein